MLIKALSLRILFIDCKTIYRIFIYRFLHKLSSQPFSSFIRAYEEHLKRAIIYAHESNRSTGIILGNKQMGNSGKSLRHILLYIQYFRFVKTKMRDPDR